MFNPFENLFKSKTENANDGKKSGAAKKIGTAATAALGIGLSVAGAVNAENSHEKVETGNPLEMNIQMPEHLTQAAPQKDMRRGMVEIGGMTFADKDSMPALEMPEEKPLNGGLQLKKGPGLIDPSMDIQIAAAARGYEATGLNTHDAYVKARELMGQEATYEISNAREAIQEMMAKEKGDKSAEASTNLASNSK